MSAYEEYILYAKLRGLDFEGYNIPAHTQQCFKDYYFYKLRPGGFLGSLLADALSDEENKYLNNIADQWNRPAIPEIKRFVREQLPPESYGSHNKVALWEYSRYNG